MTTLKTRQQKRAEKRRARKTRNLFETGLEALEVPTAVLGLHFTTTESLLYQVMLLNSDRNTGRLTRTKITQYVEWTGVKSKSSIYAALAGLNEKGVIQTETDGWVTGKVLMRYKNKDTAQMELPSGLPLERALVHRQALKLMIAYRLPALAQRLYWKLSSDLDLQTGKVHLQKIAELAKFFECQKASIYKALRQINEAELGSLIVDYGVEGHLEHVALAYQVIQLSVERMKEEAINGKPSADTKFKRYREALYRLFGVPIEALSSAEIQQGINALKDKLAQFDRFEAPTLRAPASWTDWEKELATARE